MYHVTDSSIQYIYQLVSMATSQTSVYPVNDMAAAESLEEYALDDNFSDQDQKDHLKTTTVQSKENVTVVEAHSVPDENKSALWWNKILKNLNLEIYEDDFADPSFKIEAFHACEPSVQYSILRDMGIAVVHRPVILAAVQNYEELFATEKPEPPSIWYHVPILNLGYDVLFDKTPTITEMEDTLNLLGIMGALLFAVMFALPTAFDYETYEGVIERWGKNGTYEHCDWVHDGYDHLNYFNAKVIHSIAALFLSILFSLVVYIVVENANIEKPSQVKAFWYW